MLNQINNDPEDWNSIRIKNNPISVTSISFGDLFNNIHWPNFVEKYSNKSSNNEIGEINIDYNSYFIISERNLLGIIVAHSAGEYTVRSKLYGFIAYIKHSLPHYNKLCFVVDSFFVDDYYINSVLAGYLLKKLDSVARNEKIKTIMLNIPLRKNKNCGGNNCFKRFGYKPTNNVYMKIFK